MFLWPETCFYGQKQVWLKIENRPLLRSYECLHVTGRFLVKNQCLSLFLFLSTTLGGGVNVTVSIFAATCGKKTLTPYPCLQKKRQTSRNFHENFSKFSRRLRQFAEVFGSFRTCLDAFGCVRVLSDAWWPQQNAEKPKRKFWKTICMFTMSLRSYVKTELATPHRADRKKTKKEVCLK